MGQDLLERIDAAIRELQAIRCEIAEQMPAVKANGADEADDLADALIDTTSAAARFGLARDTVAKACREVPGVGVWKGGRWQVRIGAMRQHLERKNGQ